MPATVEQSGSRRAAGVPPPSLTRIPVQGDAVHSVAEGSTATSHAPGPIAGSTHTRLLPSRPVQTASVSGHPALQTPFTQLAVPPSTEGQTFPHAPQLRTSESSAAHHSPHPAYPLAHATVHAPCTQETVPFATG